MSARLCYRALSPSLKKMCSPPFCASSYHNSSVRHSESSKKPSSSKPKQKSKTSDQDAKGTDNMTYTTGDTFFSHDGYSFYDFEIAMEKDRIVQPSSEKAKPPFVG